MLEEKTYKIRDLEAYLHTRSPKKVREKLSRYDVEYIEGSERGPLRTYEITAINDPFRLYCVFDLGVSPQTDFHKLRDFTVYLLTNDDFSWRPMEMMEEYLRRFTDGPTRQTISHYLRIFTDRELIALNGEYVYYKVYKDRGVQKHEIIEKAEYSAAWAVYWECRNEEKNSGVAYTTMYNKFGGVPRKQRKVNQNAFYLDTLDRLEEYATDSFLAEYGEIL